MLITYPSGFGRTLLPKYVISLGFSPYVLTIMTTMMLRYVDEIYQCNSIKNLPKKASYLGNYKCILRNILLKTTRTYRFTSFFARNWAKIIVYFRIYLCILLKICGNWQGSELNAGDSLKMVCLVGFSTHFTTKVVHNEILEGFQISKFDDGFMGGVFGFVLISAELKIYFIFNLFISGTTMDFSENTI